MSSGCIYRECIYSLQLILNLTHIINMFCSWIPLESSEKSTRTFALRRCFGWQMFLSTCPKWMKSFFRLTVHCLLRTTGLPVPHLASLNQFLTMWMFKLKANLVPARHILTFGQAPSTCEAFTYRLCLFQFRHKTLIWLALSDHETGLCSGNDRWGF